MKTTCCSAFLSNVNLFIIDDKPASKLSGMPWRRGGKRKEEFEHLQRKSQCKMLIGRDDISNDIITIGTCFSKFVYIRAHCHFALIGGNLTTQSTGRHRGIGDGIQIPEMQLQALLPFPALPPECPEELARRLLDEI